ncbi:hypothetical protein SeLEV6574_g02881 [Synchytrium endobioticum]|uniref:Dicer-like protein 1 n=1 Tax=Synchytrium endobioticum TaxID=286115 RepID=A0A507D6C2_9FUNG|nr:hypothetical protein SeLEV6574_g02881 [Synchytrium endobioticum]
MATANRHAPKPLPPFLISALPNREAFGVKAKASGAYFGVDAGDDEKLHRPLEDPRSYQLQLFKEAQEQNIIAILDTGTGKTLIASMLIKHYVGMQMDAERANDKTERRIAFFLVPTVPLAWQQHRQLSVMLDRVGVVVGDMGKARDKSSWDALLKSHNVIVCTPAIFRNALEAGFLSLLQVLIIVFDEAHHAIGNADYAVIMEKYYPRLSDKYAYKPRVLGLTASPVTGDNDDPIIAIQALERILKSLARTVIWNDHKQYANLGKPAELDRLSYDAAPSQLPQTELISTLKSLLEQPPPDLNIPENIRHRLRTKDLDELEFEILRNLGTYACDRAVELLLQRYHRKLMTKASFQSMNLEDLLAIDETEELEIEEEQRKTSLLGMIGHLFPGRILPPKSLSHKVERLFTFLESYKSHTVFKGIIFVQRRVVADLLADLIHKDERLHFCRVAVLKGHGGRSETTDKESMISQVKTVEDFRVNKLNLLVATAVAEEGLDIPECNLVVRFDPRNMKLGSLIQSRGRARSANARFVVMIERHHGQDGSILMRLWGQEQLFRAHLAEVSRATDPKARYKELLEEEVNQNEVAQFAHEPYRVESTGATLQLTSCMSLLNRFCQGVSRRDGYDWKAFWSYETLKDGQFMATLTLPGTVPKDLRLHKGGPAHRVMIAQQLAAFNAIKALHREEYFDNYLQPICSEDYIKHSRQDEDKARLQDDLNTLRGRRRKRIYTKCVPEAMTTPWTDVATETLDTTKIGVDNNERGPSRNFSDKDGCKPMSNMRRQAWLCVPYTMRGTQDEMYPVGVFSRRKPTNGIQFSLWPAHCEVRMKMISEADPVLLTEDKWNAVVKFHCYLMTSFLKDEVERKFDSSYYCVPLNWDINRPVIDWQRLFEIANHNPKDHRHLLYSGDIVGRIVQDKSYYDRQHAVVAFRPDLKPADAMPPEYDSRSKSAMQKYTSSGRFKKRPINPDQPILVGHIMQAQRRLNMLHEKIVEGVKEARQYQHTPLLPDFCSVYPLTVEEFDNTERVPSILYYFEMFAVAYDLKSRLGLPAPVGSILQALTTPSTGLPHSYERLETLGDSFLKMAINLHLYARLPLRDEGHMSMQTNFLVSNYQLFKSANRKGVPDAINATTLSRTTWRPFGSGVGRWEEREKGRQERGIQLPIEVNPPPGTHVLSDKQVADVMESLLGAAVISGDAQTHGVEDGAKTLKAVYSDASESDWRKYYDLIKKRTPGRDGSWKYLPGLLTLVDAVEELLGYKFNQPGWLLEALTHSTAADEFFNSYQRLEFLGDAVLGYLAVRHFYYTFPEADPHQLSDLKDAAVCNAFLANIAVSAGMHKWMRHMSAPLMHGFHMYLNDLAAERYHVEESMKSEDDDSRRYWEDLEPPKAVSDLVEAVLGAVFVDSELSTMAVWKVLEKIWIPWVDRYIKPTTVKRVAVRVLAEELRSRGCVEHKVKAYLEGPRAFISKVTIHGKVFAEARGDLRKKATLEASELALKMIREDPKCLDGWCDCQPEALEQAIYAQGARQDWDVGRTSGTPALSSKGLAAMDDGSKDSSSNSAVDKAGVSAGPFDLDSDIDDEDWEDCSRSLPGLGGNGSNGVGKVGDEIAKVVQAVNSRTGDDGFREYDHEYTVLGQFEDDGGQVVGM